MSRLIIFVSAMFYSITCLSQESFDSAFYSFLINNSENIKITYKKQSHRPFFKGMGAETIYKCLCTSSIASNSDTLVFNGKVLLFEDGDSINNSVYYKIEFINGQYDSNDFGYIKPQKTRIEILLGNVDRPLFDYSSKKSKIYLEYKTPIGYDLRLSQMKYFKPIKDTIYSYKAIGSTAHDRFFPTIFISKKYGILFYQFYDGRFNYNCYRSY